MITLLRNRYRSEKRNIVFLKIFPLNNFVLLKFGTTCKCPMPKRSCKNFPISLIYASSIANEEATKKFPKTPRPKPTLVHRLGPCMYRNLLPSNAAVVGFEFPGNLNA